jgi:hypothetical protein
MIYLQIESLQFKKHVPENHIPKTKTENRHNPTHINCDETTGFRSHTASRYQHQTKASIHPPKFSYKMTKKEGYAFTLSPTSASQKSKRVKQCSTPGIKCGLNLNSNPKRLAQVYTFGGNHIIIIIKSINLYGTNSK